ncbi:MAG: hypothetical protein JF597_41775 [Streptomyces sp.]|uniref:condensation domain-containing protein n=1 Tax=Streptomyces sp. TaxID=1931 RepID=UPI0025EED91C|nr:condensation domain-containing protein [Streptomyces sp.]MBW8799878.1 hypothetical protein [Streptomyces sp.]
MATLAQAALWIGEQKPRTSAGRNICTVLDVDGAVGAGRVIKACAHFTASTPASRLRFGIDRTGRVVQWLDETPPEVTVLAPCADPASDPQVTAAVHAAAARDFELDGGPLARFVVAPGQARHRVALVVHHLTGDGACQPSVVRRLAAAIMGDCPEEPEAAYRALVETVRAVESHGMAEHSRFWDLWLENCHSRGLFDRAADPGPRRPAEAAGGVRFQVRVPTRGRAASSGSLFSAAVRHSARTLREAGWDDPFLAVATSTRPPEGGPDEPVMGCFVNQVPLAVTPDADEEVWREGLRHRAFPYARLVSLARARADRPELQLDRVLLTYRRVHPRMCWAAEDGTGFQGHLGWPYPGSPSDFTVRVFDFGTGLDVQVVLGERAVGRYEGSAIVAGLAEGLRTSAAESGRRAAV